MKRVRAKFEVPLRFPGDSGGILGIGRLHTSETKPETLMSKRILVVEDDPEMRLLTTAILERRGFDVKAVETGCEALAEMRQSLFDLVVLDVLLPDANGISLCEQIKKQNFMVFMPVILLTSVTDESVKRQGFRMGADEYMNKPPSPIELVGRVQELLSEVERRRTPDLPTTETPFIRPVFA